MKKGPEDKLSDAMRKTNGKINSSISVASEDDGEKAKDLFSPHSECSSGLSTDVPHATSHETSSEEKRESSGGVKRMQELTSDENNSVHGAVVSSSSSNVASINIKSGSNKNVNDANAVSDGHHQNPDHPGDTPRDKKSCRNGSKQDNRREHFCADDDQMRIERGNRHCITCCRHEDTKYFVSHSDDQREESDDHQRREQRPPASHYIFIGFSVMIAHLFAVSTTTMIFILL